EPVRLQPLQSDVLLERAMPVRQMAQLHRLYDVVDDECRAQPGSQAEKKHLAALVAAQRLHHSIVHEPARTIEGLLIVRAGPSRAEVTWLRNRTTMEHRTWEADRDRVVRPSRAAPLHPAD